jgi:hypothetical protein
VPLIGHKRMPDICTGLQSRLMAQQEPRLDLEGFSIPSDHQPVMTNCNC